MAKNGFFRRIADWFVRPAAAGSLTTVLAVIAAVVLLGGFATYRIQAMNANAEDDNQPFAPVRAYQLFEGTPAAAYQEGAAGIVLPPATRQGEWSAADVAKALTQVKNALVASHLDRRTLVNRDPAAFLAMLTPHSRQIQLQALQQNLSTPVVRVAANAKLADAAPRVSGKTTVSVNADGFLAVKTNYVWSYAFRGVPGAPGANVVVLHDEIEWRLSTTDPVLDVYDIDSYLYNVSCADIRAGVIAPEPPFADAGLAAGDGPDFSKRAYDPQQAMDVPDKCASPSPSS